MLTGGLGNDVFLFDASPGVANLDQVKDFNVAQDGIHLAVAIFTQLAAGGLSPDAFFIGASAHDASDRIIYNGTTGALSYDADGLGGAAQMQFATLSTGLALTNTNFTAV